MIKDAYLKIIFVPLLGIFIPLVSGIIIYENYSVTELVGANLYFIFTSFLIWRGCNWIHARIRPFFRRNLNPFIKIISLSLVPSLYGATAGGSLTMVWFRFSGEEFTFTKLFSFFSFTTMAVVLFTLIYEILYLNKERDLDNKIVTELDRDRMQAEMAALQNELDPHFIFNSLNTLNHLIITSPEMAYLYNNRLAQVYKYFLVNRDRELVSLQHELDFIENYFFLLQVRHENKLELETDTSGNEGKIMVPPCALQTLIENAIKHNEFSADNPLKVKISLNGNFLKVSNNIKPKPYLASSTKIGLKNLSSRYKLVCNKDIIIEANGNLFEVKLPLISNS
jgi:hypothetical protein